MGTGLDGTWNRDCRVGARGPHQRGGADRRGEWSGGGVMTTETVWFDLENTPHVLFLEPVIHRLQKLDVPVSVTAKPQSQTLELADARRIEYEVVGEGNVR